MKQQGRFSIAIVIGCAGILLLLICGSRSTLQLKQAAARQYAQQTRQRTASFPRTDSDWVNKGDRIMQQARSTQSEADYGRAEAAYGHALTLNPVNIRAMTGMAWVNGVRHAFEDSIQWVRRAMALQPENPKALGLWGDALVEMGDYDAAFEKYQQMIDLRPDLGSYSRGAHLLFLTGDTDNAIRLMHKAVNAGGPHMENIAWCRAQLAIMYHGVGDDVKAEALLRAALKQAPHNFHLLVAMARVKTALKSCDEAISFYQQAIDQMPQPAVIVELGDLYRSLDRAQEARQQ